MSVAEGVAADGRVAASARRWRHEREARPHHGHHGPGRLLPRRAAARQGLRGPRHGPPRVDREVRAHRAPARPHHAPPGRPARPPLAGRHAARLEARRGLQPRRDVVRRRLLDPADADRGVHRRRRHAAARVHPRGLPRGPLLPGVLERDVRQGARDAADRDDAVLPALALRRGQGLRPPHHGQLPRVLRHVPDVGDPLQPRVRAPRAGVRDAQGHLARGGDQARPARRGRPRQPRGQARLGLREGLRRGDVADAPARQARRLRDRDRRDQHRPAAGRGRVRPGRRAVGAARADRRRVQAPGRGRPAGRRRLEGGARAGLEADRRASSS